MDTALLAGTNTDSLTVLHIAYRIRLRIFQSDKGYHQITFRCFREILIPSRNIRKEFISIQLYLITSLLKRDTKDILMFNRGRLIAGTYLNHIVSSFTLFPQDSQCFVRIPRSNNAIRDLAVNKTCSSLVAHITQSDKVTIGRHTVGTAGTHICASKRRERKIIHKINLLHYFVEFQTDGGPRRTDVLE